MLIRLWTYQVKKVDVSRFEEFEKRAGIPMMQNQVGCLGVEMLRQGAGEGQGEAMLEYRLISRWESWDVLQIALASKTWQDEVTLFLAQNFGEGNGTIAHFEIV